MAMAVTLSLTLFRFESSSGCASVTFLRSARVLFASAVIFSFLGHSLLGIVLSSSSSDEAPFANPTLRSRSRSILVELTECQQPLPIPLKGALIVPLRESRRITRFDCMLYRKLFRGDLHPEQSSYASRSGRSCSQPRS